MIDYNYLLDILVARWVRRGLLVHGYVDYLATDQYWAKKYKDRHYTCYNITRHEIITELYKVLDTDKERTYLMSTVLGNNERHSFISK